MLQGKKRDNFNSKVMEDCIVSLHGLLPLDGTYHVISEFFRQILHRMKPFVVDGIEKEDANRCLSVFRIIDEYLFHHDELSLALVSEFTKLANVELDCPASKSSQGPSAGPFSDDPELCLNYADMLQRMMDVNFLAGASLFSRIASNVVILL